MLARASQAVIGFSDALMSAPLGQAALAAVTTASLNAFALIILPMGTVLILQSFTAQLRGRGELSAVRRYAWYGLLLSLLSELLALSLVPLIGPALELFDYSPVVREQIETYLGIRLGSVGFAVAIEALGSWYGGLGNTRPAMIAGVVAMVANVLANYVLIEPRLGLPGFGVAGAAWASVLGTSVGLCVMLWPFARGAQSAGDSGRLELRLAELGRVLRFGLPNGINWFLEFAAFATFINVMVAHLGTTVLAAFNVVIQLNSVAFMPAFGLASAGSILVGEAIGRRSFGDARRFVRLTLGLSALWMVSVGVVYFVFPGPLIAAFSLPGPEVLQFVATGTLMLRFSAFWQLFDAAGITLSESLRAAGDTTWCMVVRIVLAWIVFMPAAWFFVIARGGGSTAVMLLVVAYICALSLSFALRFLSGRWQRIDLIGERPVVPRET